MSTSRGRAWRRSTIPPSRLRHPSGPAGLDRVPPVARLLRRGDAHLARKPMSSRQKTKGKSRWTTSARAFQRRYRRQSRCEGLHLRRPITGLNAVARHDWKSHLTRRVSGAERVAPARRHQRLRVEARVQGNRAVCSRRARAFKNLTSRRRRAAWSANGKVLDIIPDSAAARPGWHGDEGDRGQRPEVLAGRIETPRSRIQDRRQDTAHRKRRVLQDVRGAATRAGRSTRAGARAGEGPDGRHPEAAHHSIRREK